MMNFPIFNQIYDNGALILGNIQKIIDYIRNDETLDCQDYKKLLLDLQDILTATDYSTIVVVNYENPVRYLIEYWTNNDVVVI